MFSSAYVWAKILSFLEDRLSAITVSAWFDDAEVVELTDNRLVIYSPDEFRRSMIRNRCADHIHDALKEIFNSDAKLEVFDEKELDAFRKKDAPVSSMDFNPQFCFDTFVVGDSNNLAYGAARAVAENPGGVYNPLYFYGPPGVGKTHLLYAIANEIRKNHPEYNILYIKGDDFINDFVEAITQGNNKDFHTKYREADLLLVDDIQFIAGKKTTQEEFFHTFNKLYEDHKQIVMTSDRRPDDILNLEERLRSRFVWGLTIDISLPDYETRLAILRKKAKDMGLGINDDVCNYLAINITASVRQLEGTMKKIMAYRDLDNMPMDLDNVSRAIGDMVMNDDQLVPTPSLIVSQVCKFYNVDEIIVRGSQRNKGVAEPRQVAMYMLRTMTNLSLPDIGLQFGKDHTTVLYAVKKIEEELKSGNLTLKNNIADISANIHSLLK